tara:strand:- start:235 stop:891 length:657 start_codon:yes stop_codon:yes gene_type:complete
MTELPQWEDDEDWFLFHDEDLWFYDKLILSRRLGYTCGPVGEPVPNPGYYVVRPITNLLGMGRNTEITWITDSTDNFPPGHFWCEVFEGDHLSIDYHFGKQFICVKGTKNNSTLYKWDKWEKIDQIIPFPEILKTLKGNYEWINIEMIGGNLIEVHFRRNPNFFWGNTYAIPVWDNNIKLKDNEIFIECPSFHRKGFVIDKINKNRDRTPSKSSILTK